MPADELTCQALVEIVTDYLDGSMTAGERLRFEEHLAICPGCDAYVDQMRETIRLSGMLREEDLDPAARDRLLESFRTWKRRRDARV
jgi:anti-sigma factor RsiW